MAEGYCRELALNDRGRNHRLWRFHQYQQDDGARGYKVKTLKNAAGGQRGEVYQTAPGKKKEDDENGSV